MKPPPRDDGLERNLVELRACRNMAKEAFEEAMDGENYIWGGQPFDEDHLYHKVFYCAEELGCHMHAEQQYYAKCGRHGKVASWCDETLCSNCAGITMMPRKVEFGIPFSTVLPLCEECVT